MLNMTKLYYFSPTGGTRRSGEFLSKEISKSVTLVDLGAKNERNEDTESDLVVFAAPVFGGRIPALVTEKLHKLNGSGKKCITMVVYGNRAYDDALLELNDVVERVGFQVVASCSCVAQHSMAPKVGEGRPDESDYAGIRDFAKQAAAKFESAAGQVTVPGNHPYKTRMSIPATPISQAACNLCGACGTSCPTDAITFGETTVITNPDQCILCMTCVAVCPENARILPPPLQENLEHMLSAAKTVRQENEYFL